MTSFNSTQASLVTPVFASWVTIVACKLWVISCGSTKNFIWCSPGRLLLHTGDFVKTWHILQSGLLVIKGNAFRRVQFLLIDRLYLQKKMGYVRYRCLNMLSEK
ncbi:unnamed protein product [Clavelina lepadiformis]|uniref:Cyclic nucleotide-binding domain-containing protein n=1 Tax=Clavelina lepadiformis TaxID=159417 RepID=A0ABP0GGH4_CLALP